LANLTGLQELTGGGPGGGGLLPRASVGPAGGLGGQRLLPGAAEARGGAGAWKRRRRPWPRPARRSTTMDGITERWPRAAG
jgi:hypothetical protein